MGKGKRMTGTSWHIEYLDDKHERTRRGLCEYYDDTTGLCHFFHETCKTNSTCSRYRPCKKEKKITGYFPVAISFEGIKAIDMNLIDVSDDFEELAEFEKNDICNYFKEHGYKFKYPISVSCENGRYILKNCYKIFCTAKWMGLKRIDARIYQGISCRRIEHWKKLGKTIRHKSFGRGQITKVEGDIMTVDFKSNGVKKLNVVTCLKNNLFTHTKKI